MIESERNINIPFSGWEKHDFIKRIEELEHMNYSMYKELKHLNSTTDYNLVKPANERGAGRKPLTYWQGGMLRKNILFWHSQGWAYRKIASHEKVSVGTVHKLINEHKEKKAKNP